MSVSTIDTRGIENIVAFLMRVEKFDPGDMLDHWTMIVIEGNRAGILSGTNKDGVAVSPPLKYRTGAGSPTKFRGNRFAQQRGAGTVGGALGHGPTAVRYKVKNGVYRATHRGTSAGTINNNLTTAQYRELTGPFSAPRGDESRSIANFKVKDPRQVDDKTWEIRAGWVDVVDTRGQEFYSRLFAAPGRDMRGIRPADLDKCSVVMVEWATHLMNEARHQGLGNP